MEIPELPIRTQNNLFVISQPSIDSIVKNANQKEPDESNRKSTKEKIFQSALSNWTQSLIENLHRKRPESGGIQIETRDTNKSSGEMYLFNYNPLTKQNLNYYDVMPLVLVTGSSPGGFVGINFHLLPIQQRTFIISKILKDYNPEIENSFKGIDFSVLYKKEVYKLVRPCFRRYYDGRISSLNIVRIGPEDWMDSISMPLEKFRKLSRETVFSLIRKSQNDQ